MTRRFDRNPAPIEHFPCGAADPSRGGLWAEVFHCRQCKHRACLDFITWFEKFRADWLRRHHRRKPTGTKPRAVLRASEMRLTYSAIPPRYQ